jgi:hypothetical protein
MYRQIHTHLCIRHGVQTSIGTNVLLYGPPIQFIYTRESNFGPKNPYEVLLGASWGTTWERWEPHGNIRRTDCEQGKKKKPKNSLSMPLIFPNKTKLDSTREPSHWLHETFIFTTAGHSKAWVWPMGIIWCDSGLSVSFGSSHYG